MLTRSFSRFRLPVALLLAATLLLPAWAWGPTGHTMIAVAAARDLPASMPAFVRDPEMLGYLANEPDRWRGHDIATLNGFNAPDHFIDLEPVAFLHQFPENRYQFIADLYQRAEALRAAGHPRQAAALNPTRVGFQPYATMEYFQRLVRAFQEYREAKARHLSTRPMEQEAVVMMGILSHFVGDGSQPLHTTINYNGWVQANPDGYTTSHKIHWEFESIFVDRAIAKTALDGRLQAPQVLRHPMRDYVSYLRQTHTQVVPLYQLEKAGGFAGKGTAASRAFVAGRLEAGAQMLANLYYTAWVLSGQQQPAHLLGE